MKDGEYSEAKGVAKLTDTPALLRVSFWGPFYSDYRIMLLDDGYQYALIGSGSDDYLWILSRTPQISEEVKSVILNEAQKRGYDTGKLIWVKQ
ncbi:MAG: lipocalin family protein [Paraprevotella sp.]|nr:lipocalin family protein [Paraprevotella sp.]